MSGGHYNYGCFAISYFAEELARDIRTNDVDTQLAYGGTVGFHHPPETLDRLRRAEQIIRVAADLAKEAEWLYSGDTSPAGFNVAFDKIIAEYRRTRFHAHSS